MEILTEKFRFLLWGFWVCPTCKKALKELNI